MKFRIPTILIFLIEVFIYKAEFYSQFILPTLTMAMIFLLSSFRFQLEAMTFPSILILFAGVLGYLGSESKNSTLGTSVSLILPSEFRIDTLSIFCISSSALILGNSIAGKSFITLEKEDLRKQIASNTFLAYFALLPAILMVIGFKTSEFFHRDSHLLGTQIPLLARLGSATSIIAVPVIALWAMSQGKIGKILGILEILFYGIIFLAASSRSLVVIPISLYFVVFRQVNKISKIFFGALLPIASYFCLAIPLYLRSQMNHGIYSYFRDLFKFSPKSVSPQVVLQNTSVAFDLNGLTAFSLQKFPLKDLFVELSPLLGKQAGCYDIAPNHRFNFSTPAAAIGEGLNYGFYFLVAIFALVGLAFGLMIKKTQLLPEKYRLFGAAFILASASYFSVLSLQYNLRSAVRVIYYAAAFVIMIQFFSRFRKSSIRNHSVKIGDDHTFDV